MSDVMLCGILRMPFDDRGDIHLMQLKQACREAANELEHREAEIARLREALRPFSKLADKWPAYDWNDDEDVYGSDVPTVGDLRRARAALETKG